MQIPAECPQVQDAHPWLKTVCEEDVEKGEGAVEDETMYETDKEEFTRAVNPSILPAESRLDATPAVPAQEPRLGKY